MAGLLVHCDASNCRYNASVCMLFRDEPEALCIGEDGRCTAYREWTTVDPPMPVVTKDAEELPPPPDEYEECDAGTYGLRMMSADRVTQYVIDNTVTCEVCGTTHPGYNKCPNCGTPSRTMITWGIG